MVHTISGERLIRIYIFSVIIFTIIMETILVKSKPHVSFVNSGEYLKMIYTFLVLTVIHGKELIMILEM